MKRMTKLLILLTVTAIIGFSFGDVSFAARVTRIHTNKGHIYIDKGKDAGFVMGAKVCFYTSSGELITCGKVRKTTNSYSMVEVDNRKAKKINYGTEVTLGEKEEDEKKEE